MGDEVDPPATAREVTAPLLRREARGFCENGLPFLPCQWWEPRTVRTVPRKVIVCVCVCMCVYVCVCVCLCMRVCVYVCWYDRFGWVMQRVGVSRTLRRGGTLTR